LWLNDNASLILNNTTPVTRQQSSGMAECVMKTLKSGFAKLARINGCDAAIEN
jgi:hypothetical protein